MSDLDRACPACGAEAGAKCVTANGKPTTVHHARLLGYAGRRNKVRRRNI